MWVYMANNSIIYGVNGEYVHKAPSIYNKSLCEIFSTIEFP